MREAAELKGHDIDIIESVAMSRSRDKLRSLQLLSRKGIGMPRTGFANHPDYHHDVQRVVRREAMQDRFVVDPSVEYLLSHFVRG